MSQIIHEAQIVPEQPQMAVAVREAQAAIETKPAPAAPLTAAQARVDSMAEVLAAARAKASTLQLTPDEIAKLKADFPDEAFKLGAGGDPNLLYIEHAYLRDRFDAVLGMCQWSLMRSRPHWPEEYTTNKGTKAIRLYADCVLLIRGCLVSEAIGDMSYFPNNAAQSYGDAAEGSETAAFRRCAKKIGVGLQAWKKDFGEGWKARKRQPQQTFTPEPPPAAPAPKSAAGPIRFDERDEKKFRAEAEKQLEKAAHEWAEAHHEVRTWSWAVVNGRIMQNEQLSAVTWDALFDTAWIDNAVKAITQGKCDQNGALRRLSVLIMERQAEIAKATQDIGVGDAEQHAFDAVYGAPALGQPSGPPPTIPIMGTGTPPAGTNAAGGRVPTTCPHCQSTATKTSKDYDLVSFCEKCGWQFGEGGKPYEAHPWASVICPIPPSGTKKADYDKAPLTLGQIMRTENKRFYGLIMNNQEAKGWTDRSGTLRPASAADKKFADACKEAVAHLDSKKPAPADDNLPF